MLSGKQRSYLRGQANQLDPVVHVGKEGITEAVIEQVDQALEDHELIKVRILENSGEEVKQVAQQLADVCGAQIVQIIGNICILFRQNEEESEFDLD